jgi:Putative zinc-finger
MIEGSHVTGEKLRRLGRRELTPREIAEVLRHVGACRECARAAAAEAGRHPDSLQRTIFDDEGPWHPEPADIAAYADGTAGPAEREIVASHLEDCALCREDVQDLATLRRWRSRRRAWRIAIAAAAAIIAVVISVVLLLSRRHEPGPLPTSAPVVTTQPSTTVTTIPEPQQPPRRYANAEWEQLVRTAEKSGRLSIARGIDATPAVLRGPGGKTTMELAPSGVVLDETRPRFSWPSRDGAMYVVSIYSGDEPVAQSEALTETRWTPAVPLARGRTYVWQVQATRDPQGLREIIPAPPAPPAMFRIVSKRDHDELAEAMRLHPDDHLLHAVLYARAGLREETLHALSRARTNIRAH